MPNTTLKKEMDRKSAFENFRIVPLASAPNLRTGHVIRTVRLSRSSFSVFEQRSWWAVGPIPALASDGWSMDALVRWRSGQASQVDDQVKGSGSVLAESTKMILFNKPSITLFENWYLPLRKLTNVMELIISHIWVYITSSQVVFKVIRKTLYRRCLAGI